MWLYGFDLPNVTRLDSRHIRSQEFNALPNLFLSRQARR